LNAFINLPSAINEPPNRLEVRGGKWNYSISGLSQAELFSTFCGPSSFLERDLSRSFVRTLIQDDSLLILSKRSVNRIYSVLVARRQALYYCARSQASELDPLTLRILPWMCYKSRSTVPATPTVLHAVRLGIVPGDTRGRKPKWFTSQAESQSIYLAQSCGPGNPLLPDPDTYILTVRSASPSSLAGWRLHITFPGRDETLVLWVILIR